MKVVVFLGPSLPRRAAAHCLPDAIFLPPARQADVLSAVDTYAPDVIALIDGVFGQSLSVWHKEILFALERGVRVIGGASMGALRAAELDAFGMRGVGEIFRRLRAGELQDDDEVALVHAGADEDYRPLSEPMINLRATFERAYQAGVVSNAQAERLVNVAKDLYFVDRTLPNILSRVELPSAVAVDVSTFFATQYVDVKAADARLVLQAAREVAEHPRGALVRSRAFARLYDNDRCVRHADADVPLRSIATYAALNLPDFDELNGNALNRALALVLAEVLRIEPTQAQVEAELARFRRQHGLSDAAAVERWRRQHHLSKTDMHCLMRELATCRRLHQWLLGSHHADHQTRWLLDELRLRGRYVDAANRATAQQVLERAVGPRTESLAELGRDELLELVPEHQRASGWQPTAPIDEWAEEAGFKDDKDLAYELLRERRLREHH